MAMQVIDSTGHIRGQLLDCKCHKAKFSQQCQLPKCDVKIELGDCVRRGRDEGGEAFRTQGTRALIADDDTSMFGQVVGPSRTG